MSRRPASLNPSLNSTVVSSMFICAAASWITWPKTSSVVGSRWGFLSLLVIVVPVVVEGDVELGVHDAVQAVHAFAPRDEAGRRALGNVCVAPSTPRVEF